MCWSSTTATLLIRSSSYLHNRNSNAYIRIGLMTFADFLRFSKSIKFLNQVPLFFALYPLNKCCFVVTVITCLSVKIQGAFFLRSCEQHHFIAVFFYGNLFGIIQALRCQPSVSVSFIGYHIFTEVKKGVLKISVQFVTAISPSGICLSQIFINVIKIRLSIYFFCIIFIPFKGLF